MIRRALKDTAVRTGLILTGALALIALLSPVLAPYDPIAQLDLELGRSLAPSLAHPLGTDQYGRDVFSRILHGSRISLAIALLAMSLAVTLGTAVGLVAGYSGRILDAALMRLVDAGLAVPRVFILLVALALWEHLSVGALILIIGFTGWFDTSRIVRAEVKSISGREYITAARAAGAGPARILFYHVLPNVAAPVSVAATLGIANVVLVEAGLSYLGLGVPQPMPSWGNIMGDGHHLLVTAPWIAVSAGVAILLTVLAFTVLGDALRRAFDPRAA